MVIQLYQYLYLGLEKTVKRNSLRWKSGCNLRSTKTLGVHFANNTILDDTVTNIVQKPENKNKYNLIPQIHELKSTQGTSDNGRHMFVQQNRMRPYFMFISVIYPTLCPFYFSPYVFYSIKGTMYLVLEKSVKAFDG